MIRRLALLSLMTSAVALAACRRSPLDDLEAPRIASRSAPVGATAVDDVDAADGADPLPGGGRRIIVSLGRRDGGGSAPFVDALTSIEGGALVLTRDADRSSLQFASYVLRDGQRGPAWPADTAREPAPASAAVAPLAVALAEGPIFVLTPSANLGRQDERASLSIRVVRPDGRIDDEARWLPLDQRITFDGAWSAGVARDVAVVCFAGRGDGTIDAPVALGPPRDLFCGTLDRRGGWAHAPERVFAAGIDGDHSWTVRALWVGNSTEDSVLVAAFVAGHDYDRIVGILLDTRQWSYSVPLDLGTPRVLEPATFAWRRPPQILTTAAGTAYALPGTGLTTPLAGWLATDGQRQGNVLTIAELGSIAERTVMTQVGGIPALIYDLPGVSEVRTVVAFDGQEPFLADLERVSGLVEHNGPVGGGLVSVIVEGSGGTDLWVVDSDTLGGVRQPGRSLRMAERVRLPEPRFEDAGGRAPTDDAGHADAVP